MAVWSSMLPNGWCYGQKIHQVIQTLSLSLFGRGRGCVRDACYCCVLCAQPGQYSAKPLQIWGANIFQRSSEKGQGFVTTLAQMVWKVATTWPSWQHCSAWTHSVSHMGWWHLYETPDRWFLLSYRLNGSSFSKVLNTVFFIRVAKPLICNCLKTKQKLSLNDAYICMHTYYYYAYIIKMATCAPHSNVDSVLEYQGLKLWSIRCRLKSCTMVLLLISCSPIAYVETTANEHCYHYNMIYDTHTGYKENLYYHNHRFLGSQNIY